MTEQLRTVLRERAEVTDALGPADRVDAVHGRVRGARRRRRAVVAVAAVAGVVIAGASVVPAMRLRPAPNPADQEAPVVLAGRTVPKTQTAAGFSYHYVEGVQSRPGAAKLRLTVSAEDAPQLVMWATSSTNPAPVVRLTSNVGDEHFRSAAGGFERYMMVYPRDKVHLKLTQQHAPSGNRLALAVYALDSTPPPGIGNGTVTFRRQILDDRLVAGLIGKPGQTDLRTTIDPVHAAVRLSEFCYGASDQDYVHVAYNGEDVGGDGCSQRPNFDPGTTGGSYSSGGSPVSAHGPIHVHVWITGKNSSAPSATSRAVIGFAVYRIGGATFPLAGSNIPVRQESDGHEYVKTQSFESRPGSRSVMVQVSPSAVPRLVITAENGRGGGFTTTQLFINGSGDMSYDNGAGGASWGSGYVIQPDESPKLTFRLTHGDPGNVVLGIALADQVH